MAPTEDAPSVPNPAKYPVAYFATLWGAATSVLLGIGQTEAAAVAGAVGTLVPWVVVGVRWLLGKNTAVTEPY